MNGDYITKQYVKIGETFKVNGKLLTPIIGNCDNCELSEHKLCNQIACSPDEREDRLDVTFVEFNKFIPLYSKYIMSCLINIKTSLEKNIILNEEDLNDNEEYHKLNIMISNLEEIQEYVEKIL